MAWPAKGQWGWNQGCESTYENWDWGEPNDYCSGEDCAMMYGSGEWNDQSCRDAMRCLCEYGTTASEAFSAWDANAEATAYECDWHD